MVETPSRRRLRSTPARTISGVIGPGGGHHLVKTLGRLAPAGAPAATRARNRPAMISALP